MSEQSLQFFKDEESLKFWQEEINNFQKNTTKLIEYMKDWDEENSQLKENMISNIETIFSSGPNGFIDETGEKFFHFLDEYVLMIMFPLILRQHDETQDEYFIRILSVLLEKNQNSLSPNLSFYEEFLGMDFLSNTEETLLSREDLELLEQVVKVFNNKEKRVEKVHRVRERAIFGYNINMAKKFNLIHGMVGFKSSKCEERDNLRGRTHITNQYWLDPDIEKIINSYGDLTVGLLLLIYMSFLSVNKNRLTQEARNHLLEFLAWSLIFGVLEGNSISDSEEPEVSKFIKLKSIDFVEVIYSIEKFVAYMIGRDNWLQSLYGPTSKDRRKRVPSKLIRVRAGKFLLRNNSIRAALSNIRVKPGLGGD